MRKLLLIAILPFLIGQAVYAEPASKYPGRAITIAFAEDYPPFSWRTDDDQAKGILRDFLDELLEIKMGLAIDYGIYPWARGQKLVKDGLVDAFFTIPNADRLSYTKITELPIFTSDYYMYTGKNNPNLETLRNSHTLKELKEHTQLTHAYIVGGGWHGVNLGDVTNKWIEQNSKRILTLLEFNRVDVYIEQRPLMNYQMKLLGYKGEIIEVPNKMDITSWHLCIGNKSPFQVILPKLDKIMSDMVKNGEMEKIQEEIFSRYK